MDLDTANTIRIAVLFLVVLVVISISWPKYGIPFAILWAGVVLWQWFKQKKR